MRNAKLWAFIGAAIVLFVLNMVFGWSDALSGTDAMATMRALLEENALVAGLVYVLVSAVACVVLMMPGFVFALVAGALFGPVWGTLLCWVAVTAGAVVSPVSGEVVNLTAPVVYTVTLGEETSRYTVTVTFERSVSQQLWDELGNNSDVADHQTSHTKRDWS